MSLANDISVPIRHPDRFFIGGQWVTPSSDATISVIDSHTEDVYFTVAEAQAADIDRAVSAAREAFDNGPWPRLTHAERAEYLRALGEQVVTRAADIAQMWPRESGVLAAVAQTAPRSARKHTFDYYAGLADTFQWERPARPAARRLRADRPGAGRRRRRDHPVERADGADQHEARPGAASPAARSSSSPRRRRRARGT